MRSRLLCFLLLSMVILIGTFAIETPVYANGGEFFLPQSGDYAKPDLVYFGQIKDTQGHFLDDVEIAIHVSGIELTFPFSNDRPGHYRSPDLGILIKNTGASIEPSKITISCSKEGYEKIKPTTNSVPDKMSGTYEIDFTMVMTHGAPKKF